MSPTAGERAGATPGAARLAANTGWNVLGLAAPMLAAFFATPLLIHGLGTDRFGVLTLAWAVVGYFSLLDFGLGRAITQGIVERLSTGREAEVSGFAWAGIWLVTLFGTAGTAVLLPLVPSLAHDVLNVAPGLQRDTAEALTLLALSLPFVTGMAGLRAVLEAYHLFGLVNAIRVPLGIFSFVGPLLVLPFTDRMGVVVGVLLASRVASWGLHLLACLYRGPELRRALRPDRSRAGELLRYGGWMTAGMVATSLMVYLDRFLIGAVISVAAVAYYVTPFDLMLRVSALPGALVGALFPVFAAGLPRSDAAAGTLSWSLRLMLAAFTPLILVVVALAPEGLTLWLGTEFAQQGTPVLRWIAVGVLLNSVGMLAAARVQGAGRPDLTGKLSLAELPAYVVLLGVAVHGWGLEGAAVAWTVRVAVDTLLLLRMAASLTPGAAGGIRLTLAALAAATALCGGAAWPDELGARALYLAVALPGVLLLAWSVLLSGAERERVVLAVLSLRARLRGKSA